MKERGQNPEPASRGARAFFVFALLFHLCVYGYYVFPATVTTKAVTEPDDAYAYILKAEALAHCPSPSRCAALASLLEQSRASTVEKFTHDRFTGRFFCNYSMLHSVALNVLAPIAGSWEGAYNLLVAGGGVFLSLAFALLIAGLFGLPAAGVFLLFFTSVKYAGAGWQYIVPTNLSVACAAVSWHFAIRARGRPAALAMAAATAASLLFHPLGLALVAVTVMLLAAGFAERRRIDSFPLAALAVAVVTAKLLTRSFQVPGLECSFGAHLGLEPLNFTVARDTLGQWVHQQRGGWLTILLLGGLGLSAAPRRERIAAAVLSLALLALMVISTLYVLPGYAAELFIRLLLPFGLFASGILGAGIVKLARLGWEERRARPFGARAPVLALVFIGLAFDRAGMLKQGLLGPPEAWESLRFWRGLITRSPEQYWDRDQVATLLAQAKPDSRIVFDSETTLSHALAYGLVDREVDLLPFRGPADALEPNARADFFVLTSPIQPFLLSAGPVRIVPGKGAGRISLLVENRGFRAAKILAGGASLEIPARARKEIAVERGALAVSLEGNSPVVLEGARSEGSSLHWPWDAGWSFEQNGKAARPETAGLRFGPYGSFPTDVVADGGHSVVVKPRGKLAR